MKFQLKDERGLTRGGLIEEVIDAPSSLDATALISRKYGNVQFFGGPTSIQETQSSSSGPSGGAESQPNGCLVLLGGIALVVAMATGALKPPTQPDAYQGETSSPAQSPSDPTDRSSPDPVAVPAPEISSDQPSSQSLWGAFAVSPSTSRSAYSTAYPSEMEAKQAAIDSCGESDCQLLGSFGPGYAALSESDRSWYFSSGHSSESDANEVSMRLCQEKDPDANCRIAASVSF